MDRIKEFELADKAAVNNGYPLSLTGMYHVKDFEDEWNEDPKSLLYQGNFCAICLFLHDEPYNYGTHIEPTSYDGDCDDCMRQSRFYSGWEEE